MNAPQSDARSPVSSTFLSQSLATEFTPGCLLDHFFLPMHDFFFHYHISSFVMCWWILMMFSNSNSIEEICQYSFHPPLLFSYHLSFYNSPSLRSPDNHMFLFRSRLLGCILSMLSSSAHVPVLCLLLHLIHAASFGSSDL